MTEPSALDRILNVVIPGLAIIFFLMIFYKHLQEPFDKFFGFIKKLFTRGKEKVREKKDEVWDDDEDMGYIPRL